MLLLIAAIFAVAAFVSIDADLLRVRKVQNRTRRGHFAAGTHYRIQVGGSYGRPLPRPSAVVVAFAASLLLHAPLFAAV